MHFSKEKKCLCKRKMRVLRFCFTEHPNAAGREKGNQADAFLVLYLDKRGRSSRVVVMIWSAAGNKYVQGSLKSKTFRDFELNCFARQQSPSVCYQPAFRPSKNGLQSQKKILLRDVRMSLALRLEIDK